MDVVSVSDHCVTRHLLDILKNMLMVLAEMERDELFADDMTINHDLILYDLPSPRSASS